MANRVDIGRVGVFHREEGGGAHDRRHDLAVHGGSDLHGPGLFGVEADALHHRDGEGTGGHHVGDRRAGDEAGGGGGDHRRFGRASATVAHHRQGNLPDDIAGYPPVPHPPPQPQTEHNVVNTTSP